jgi:hypothetical protein
MLFESLDGTSVLRFGESRRSAFRRHQSLPVVATTSGKTPVARNSGGTSYHSPQCSSGATQSRPFPARAAKVMESAGALNEKQCGAAPPQRERSPAPAGRPDAAPFFSVKRSHLARWAERFGVPWAPPTSPRSGISPARRNPFPAPCSFSQPPISWRQTLLARARGISGAGLHLTP